MGASAVPERLQKYLFYFHCQTEVRPWGPGCRNFLLFLAALCLASGMLLPAQGHAGQATITNEFSMTFIRIAPGTFTMGSPASEKYRDKDEIQHQVTISREFYLQETEVTQAQWQKIMGRRWFIRHQDNDSLPQTRISWHGCMKFIEKLSKKSRYRYRLPTEAEWEYACRAGSTTAYAFGETIDCTRAMFANNPDKDGTCVPYYKSINIAQGRPAPVKIFAPNAWGVYDMHGNVWEWCADIYAPYSAGPIDDSFSVTSSDSRVRRGGSFYKHAKSLRSANRTYGHPSARFHTTGFRLILEAAE